MDADIIVVGHGLAGLVAAAEAADRGRRVVIVDQESIANLGGQAWWSFGGLFLVNSPEQRRLGVKDSVELAWSDWQGTAGWDRPEDEWPRRWAQAYVEWAAGAKRAWLHSMGMRWFPVVGWAERGDGRTPGHGNSVPRFHVTWGTGPGVVEPFERRVHEHIASGRIEHRGRHRVVELLTTGGVVDGVRCQVLAWDAAERGKPSNRTVVDEVELRAQAVIVTSGGIGGNHEMVRANWPSRLGSPPAHMVTGVPAHVDGSMVAPVQAVGGAVINPDRMWHYTEGVRNWNPIWPGHGIRILPGPSSLWFDAVGNRLPPGLYPGSDTLGTLAHLRGTGHDHSWFITTERIAGKEFALSGSEQNPDLTGRSWRQVAGRASGAVPAPLRAFLDRGADFITAGSLDELVTRMNGLTDEPLLDPRAVREQVEARDLDVANDFGKDAQLMAVRSARRYLGDRLVRTAAPHRITDPAAGPLVGVKLHVLTRKSLGGVHTDLSGRVLDAAGQPIEGLFAAGEVAGFGGGGLHGYRALEGTFLGGCLFSGMRTGRAAAHLLG